MALESETPMELEESLSANGLEDSNNVHPAARVARLSRSGFVISSVCLKLLGIPIFALQFNTVSAESVMCHAFDKVTKRFDLLGLISVFGTGTATRSLAYSALNDGRFYTTGHIGPGSLSVASVLFETAGYGLARWLTLGKASNFYGLVQLNCPVGLRYIGLKSNTECPVSNAVGASIVREHQSLWKEKQRKESGELTALKGGEQQGQKREGRDSKRRMKVIILKVGRREERESWNKKEIPVLVKASKGGALLLGWLPLLLTIGVIASCCNCKEWSIAGLILWGMLGMTTAVLGLRRCVFKYFKPQVARGAPDGDCLVVDDTNADILHVVIGEEECIQTLFQRKIDYEASTIAKHLLLVAGSMLYLYVVASVLYMPNVSTSGQLHYAIANLIGLVTDVVKASGSSELGLAKKACEQFKIKTTKLMEFSNRTEAVAFVAKHAKDRTMLKTKKLLPCDGKVWQKWWELLGKCDGDADQTALMKSIVQETEREDQELLRILLDDMIHGLQTP